jgi:hypothetical protein
MRGGKKKLEFRGLDFKFLPSEQMKLDYVKRMRDRTPFRPFQIHLTSGEVLPVDHPESMSVPADEEDLFVVWTSQSWNLLEAGQVAHVSVQRRTAK